MEKKKKNSTGVVIGKILTFLLCGVIGYYIAGFLPERTKKEDSPLPNKENEAMIVQDRQNVPEVTPTKAKDEQVEKINPLDTIRLRITNITPPKSSPSKKKDCYDFSVETNLDGKLDLRYELFLRYYQEKGKQYVMQPQTMYGKGSGRFEDVGILQEGHQYYVQVSVKNDSTRKSKLTLVEGFPHKETKPKVPKVERLSYDAIKNGICLNEGYALWRKKYCAQETSVKVRTGNSERTFMIDYVHNTIHSGKWKDVVVTSAGYDGDNKVSYIEIKVTD